MAVTIYSTVSPEDAPAVKAYLDSLTLTTINNLEITALSAQRVLIVVEGT
jgi:hypothetical protein